MKWNHWIIVIVLLLLTALGGMARLNTIIGQQQAELVEQWEETDRLIAQVYWTRISLLPLPYSLPTDCTWVSSGCGYRMDPMGGATESLHKGIDIPGAIGTTIDAALAGRVAEHWPPPGTPCPMGGTYRGHSTFGGLVVIDHGGGLFTLYGHLSDTCVHEGYWVEAGQEIGRLGDTGITTGPHLHFEVVVDPLRYLEER